MVSLMQLDGLAEQLQALGLSEKQSKVYVAGLFLGPASVLRIAEQAGINRPTAYLILDELAELGLVSQSTVNKRTVFTMADPESLDLLFRKQEDEARRRRQQLMLLQPGLEEITRKTGQGMPAVRFVKGKEGVESIMAEAVRKTRPGSVIYSITNHDEVLKVFPDILTSNPPVRLSKQLSSKQFYSFAEGVIPSDPKILKETIKLDEPAAASLTFYEEIALFMSYGVDEKHWTGMVIESKDIVKALRQIFELGWSNKGKS